MMRNIHFGRETAGKLQIAEKKEWLITNGIGGYGSGTLAGSITRGYHGLLVASLHPPIDRKIMLVKLDEKLDYRNNSYDLTTNRWTSGGVSPVGYANIESFTLVGTVPTWRYACADAILEKRIWMEQGKNTTYVSYTVIAATAAVKLTVSAIADNRVFHNTGQVSYPMEVNEITDGIKVTSRGDNVLPLFIKLPDASIIPKSELYSDFYLPEEASRGLNSKDSHVHVADFQIELTIGDTITLLASTEADASFDGYTFSKKQQEESQLLEYWLKQTNHKNDKKHPAWIKQLVLAADQFVVNRNSTNNESGKSIIAGYHWFGDWGRDTMISLTGLTIVTGRTEIAGPILETFAEYLSEGMLPNRFPNSNEKPEYNTIDATLWFFQAIRSYFEVTNDKLLLAKLYPKLQECIAWHIKGTRYNIRVDPSDNLLSGGMDGVQLTWMDAKVGDKVITPRIGKPIEVNALWYNALKAMELFAKALNKDASEYTTKSAAVKTSFSKFWNKEKGYCFDVLDGPNGNETLLRPNQLFAVSLPESPFDQTIQKQIVDICAENLLTSHGLRSLAKFESEYIGIYTGDQYHRDSSYHQGTVWGWLIGPYITAHLKVYNDVEVANRYLNPFTDHLNAAGIGTISEIFDGDAPFTPKGCIAQAWSVGQILEVYRKIDRLSNTSTTPKSLKQEAS